jgi:hypothetical protein
MWDLLLLDGSNHGKLRKEGVPSEMEIYFLS